MRTVAAALVIGLAVLGSGGSALAQYDEIVVTASRYEDRYQDFVLPHVAIKRRADFAVAEMTIESDSRDLRLRRDELEQTLADLGRRARAAGSVTVALLEESEEDEGETRVKPFGVEEALEAIGGGTRPDTSRVTVLLRTAISADDTLEAVDARLDAFVRQLPKPGRITLSVGSADLTLVDPAQYRAPLIAAIGTDARAIIGAVGTGQAVEIEGLENRVAWRRSGDLELTVFVPHRLRIVPGR